MMQKFVAGEHRIRNIYNTLQSKISKIGYGEKSSE